jgi:hypothetical protein
MFGRSVLFGAVVAISNLLKLNRAIRFSERRSGM